MWNEEATADEKSALLWSIRDRQGPWVTRMLDAFRTPHGRQVAWNIWTQNLSYFNTVGGGLLRGYHLPVMSEIQ